MSDKRYFPPIDGDLIHTLKILKSVLEECGLEDSPYDEETKSFFSEVFQAEKDSEYLNFAPIDKVKWTETEAANIYKAVKNLAIGRLETSERIQALKTRKDLLEKLTNIMEKSINMQKMLEFQEQVMTFMETHLSKEQLEEFLKGLEDVR